MEFWKTLNIAGGSISADAEANEQLYGQGAEPGAILGGRVRPPQTFQPLYEELTAVLAGDPIEPQGLDTPDDARVSLIIHAPCAHVSGCSSAACTICKRCKMQPQL